MGMQFTVHISAIGLVLAGAELFESQVLIPVDTFKGTSHQILWEAHLNQLLHLYSAQTKRLINMYRFYTHNEIVSRHCQYLLFHASGRTLCEGLCPVASRSCECWIITQVLQEQINRKK